MNGKSAIIMMLIKIAHEFFVHLLSNNSSTCQVNLIGVQSGSYLSEDDVARFEDIYQCT
jgi:mannose-6-phosphate isomerase-like protein (cupin superfamily)